MNRWFLRAALVLACLMALPHRCPAPIIYRAGEGWTYEPVGSDSGKWLRKRAKDQLEVAQEAFKSEDYRLALRAARRVVKVWPLSDHAGEAQYLIGRSYEARGMDERAFKEYQAALTKFPKLASYDEILQRQFAIANRFLDGQWFKLWNVIPFFPSMDKTAKLFGSISTNGPFHETGPKALMSIGTAREKQSNYAEAVKAYERAADRYYDREEISAEAQYRAGMAWFRQAKKADYDQSIAGSSIATFQDFAALHPKDERIPQTQELIAQMRTEQARGAYATGRYYERKKRYQGAVVYYNESLLKDPNSPYAEAARRKLEELAPLAEAQRQRVTAEETQFRANTRASATNLPPDAAAEPDKARGTPEPAK